MQLSIKKILAYLLPPIALIIIGMILRMVMEDSTLAIDWKLGFLFAAALVFLLAGLIALDMAMRSVKITPSFSPSLAIIFPAAFLAPFLIFILPSLLQSNGQLSESGFYLYYLWQTLVLAAHQLNRLRNRFFPISSFSGSPSLWLWVPTGALSGLALWLSTIFFTSILRASASTSPQMTMPIPLAATILLAGLGMAPWAGEFFFRDELLQKWGSRIGTRNAVILSSAIFALIQVRPLLWLPGFVFGLVACEIATRTRSVGAAILAHLVFNLLMLIIGWNLLI